ncbi:hypothetical protein M409DRAFT_68952 [Zasmidium cellare ATCC 36951]|uniref:FAD-binding FR-type domain-containing protein n=1 Tax=Zasmidium cellare ATCC 36951 TaxID=1080233 RepID=A0A6A6C9T3_ZASCE|nr:uncharacterized protein M409DRAFT_68952 [Zasmidium cellare ATCC 36951]KAF2162652.1 hypothetical protein M409DRAFT_68952 [Zasmidium cellare ATCC 36951]
MAVLATPVDVAVGIWLRISVARSPAFPPCTISTTTIIFNPGLLLCTHPSSSASHGVRFLIPTASTGGIPRRQCRDQPAIDSQDSPVPCTNTAYVESLFSCTSAYCTAEQARWGLDYQNATCEEQGIPLPSYTLAAGSAKSILRVSQQEVEAQNYTQTVVPSEAFFDVACESTNFAWALYGYWGLVILIGMCNRGFQSFRHNYIKPRRHFIHGRSLKGQSNFARSVVRFRWHMGSTLTLWGANEASSSAPSRIEGLLIALYVVMNFTRIQLGQYICDRARTLAIANIPIIWLFATRNDPLLWLTGWSFASFSHFHRWTARAATLLAIAHGIGYSVIHGWEGEYKMVWKMELWYCGVISVISMSLLVGSSFFFIRRRWYDLFLGVHFIFALVLIVCLWYHVKVQDGAFNGFIWPAVAFWAFDRLLRWTRILCISIWPISNGAKAFASFDEKQGLIRVDVTDFFKRRNPSPGAFYYIYEPRRPRGYESHPFTLCTWYHTLPGPERSSDASSQESVEKSLDASTAEPQHTFLIRPRNGFTDHLRTKASASSGESEVQEIKVFIEGPYGCEGTLRDYSTVVIVVGGAGITAAISRIYSLLSDSNPLHLVRLIWANQTQDLIDDVCAHELHGVLGNLQLKVDIYLTSTSARISQTALYEVHAGRPNISRVLEEEKQKCEGSMAVFCCGPPSMEAATRRAFARLLKEKGPRLAWFQERFGW